MKKAIWIFLVALTLVAGSLIAARKGYCVYCPAYTCYSQAQCGQCHCMVSPGGSSGHCYGW